MTLPIRTVALIGAVCLTVGWLVASTLAPPVARLQSLPQQSPAAPPAVDTLPFAQRLHVRLQQAPASPTTRRNPFAFGPRSSTGAMPRPEGSTGAPSVALADLAPSAPVGPAVSLAGIALTGDTRTAILTDGRDVFLVTTGQQVLGYDVGEVTESAVTLMTAAGVRYTLHLR